MRYDFDERLRMSMGAAQLETDKKTLEAYFSDVLSVEKAGKHDDRAGIDYVVTLQGGARIAVDVKTREKGCSRYWTDGPELALELWSQKYPPGSKKENRPGWTRDSHKRCHYVMFKFDREDWAAAYILPFQQLNRAFRENLGEWYLLYPHAEQCQAGADYMSECVFVPADVVMEAVQRVFETQTRR